jgi:ankyrin repeat protein
VAVELFFDAGMSPNTKDKDGRTALMWAAEGGHTEAIAFIKVCKISY